MFILFGNSSYPLTHEEVAVRHMEVQQCASPLSPSPPNQRSCRSFLHGSLAVFVIIMTVAATVSFSGVMMEKKYLTSLSASSTDVVEHDMSNDNEMLLLEEQRHKAESATSPLKHSKRISTAEKRFFNVHNKAHPRIISTKGDKITYEEQKSNYKTLEGKKRTIHVSKEAWKNQERLKHSDDFRYRDPLYENDCEPMQWWQETSFPNCNVFHEFDFSGKARTNEFSFFAQGGYNQIWWANEYSKEQDPELIIKILKWGSLYSDRNFDRVRRDGLILERLRQSPYVLDTYGFCGFDVLTPFADGGTLSSKLHLWQRGKIKLSKKSRLHLAFEVAAGLAAVHDIDGEGLSSVAHGDLKGSQYLFLNGTILLGDFNRGRFIRRNTTAPDTACPYTIGKNDAAFRSPEEYVKHSLQTAAIDVYALGSLLYELLTGYEVWHGVDAYKAQKLIREGVLPEIDETISKSKHPVEVALREAISMCYKFDPKDRAKPIDVAKHLEKAYLKLVRAEQ